MKSITPLPARHREKKKMIQLGVPIRMKRRPPKHEESFSTSKWSV